MFNSLIHALGASFFDLLSNGLLQASWWKVLIFTVAVTHITIVAVTIYLHRHQAHRALELHPLAAHFFRLWLWLTTGQVTKEWAAIHRKHHAKCEREGDPHSPAVFGVKKVFWEGAELYRSESKNLETLRKYGHGTPDDWIERNLYTRFSWQGVGLMMILDIALFGALGLTVWAVQMAWIPITAAGIINGIGHHAGYRNFESSDNSRNLSPWGLIIGGEELHNNHHTYPTSAKLSIKPHEFDIGWMYISILQALGLASVRKIAPRLDIQVERSSIDENTLQALITLRFEVMARYAKSMRNAVRNERKKNRLDEGLKLAMKWLHRNPEKIPENVGPVLQAVKQNHPHLAQWVAMRDELSSMWTRTNVSADQLVNDLQAWCKKAEASGVASMAEFSRLIRSSRPAFG